MAQAAAKQSTALSVAALTVTIIWGILLSGSLLLVLIVLVVTGGMFNQWKGMFNPRNYWLQNPNKRLYCGSLPKQSDLYEKLYEIQHGPEALEKLTSEVQRRSMETSPISLGNAIIGDSRSMFYDEYARFAQMHIVFAEHFTVAPLQFCVMIGLIQIHSKLDTETIIAMKQLVDAVVVLALVELGIGFKSFLWGSSRDGVLHENDKRIGDPLLSE